MEPRNPAALAFPRGSPQRRDDRLSRQYAGSPGRDGVHPPLRTDAPLRHRPCVARRAHPGLVPAIVLFVGSARSFFIHANLRWRLGPFEEVLSSPAFDHWHHHKDHNYSSMFPVMDRVFGTFYLPREWPAEYGADTPVPKGLTAQLLEPFAPTLKTRAQGMETSGSPAP
jgi:hypothetical protein